MWKKIIITCLFVLMAMLMPKQTAQAELNQKLQNAAPLTETSTVVTEDTYYKYTATESACLDIETSNHNEIPRVIIYDSEGRIIRKMEAGLSGGVNFYVYMKKGTTFYFEFSCNGIWRQEYTSTVEIRRWPYIKDMTILDYPCLTGYDEIERETTRSGDMYPYFLQDLSVRIEREDGKYVTEKFEIKDSAVSWAFCPTLQEENGKKYVYVYCYGQQIKLEYNLKSISDIPVKQIKEKEEFCVEYQNGDWSGYAFTPAETGYYDINYSVTGAFKCAYFDENQELLDWRHLGINSSYSLAASGRLDYVYMAEGHTYYFYAGPVTKKAKAKFQIKKKAVQERYVVATIEKPQDVSYTGEAFEPKPVVKYKGEDVSALGYDVTYTYWYNVKPGVAVVRADFKREHSNYALYTSFIIRQSLDKASVTIPKCTYTGSPVIPDVVVEIDGKKLEKDKDYTIEATDNINVGKAKITITGTGIYEGSVTKTFAIQKGKWNIAVDKKFIKNRNSKPFNLKAKNKTALTYASSDKKVATVNKKGKVTIKGYGISVIKVTAAADKNHTKTTVSVKVVVTSKSGGIKSIKKSSKGKAVVKLQKAAGAHGYEIKYSTDANFKKGVKKVETKKTSVTIKNLKSKTKYYVKVRSYRKVKGKKLYSDYSKVKTYTR